MSLVSIILPTYNWNHNWFSESIDSVLSQSFTDFELIIINDCSTNDIEKTILEYKQKDDRIVYIKNEQNLRLTKTLNKWIDLAIWKYIARIDDDDIWCDKNKLKKQVEFMENNPDYWLCWTNIILIDEEWKEIKKIYKYSSNKEIKKNMIYWTQFWHSSVLFRKDCIKKVWNYSEDWDYIEDHDLWSRIWIHYKLFNFDEYMMKYRVNNKWICNSNFNKQLIAFIKNTIRYKKYYKKYYLWVIYFTKKLIIFNIIKSIKKILFLKK